MTDQLFKVTGPNGESIHGGTFTYPLPDGGTPGAFVPEVEDPVMCEYGYHWTTDPTQWLNVGCRVFEAEPVGLVDRPEKDKYVSAGGRLIRERPDMIPGWWRSAEGFIESLSSPDFPWLKPQGEPDPSWRVFRTREEAHSRAMMEYSESGRAITLGSAMTATRLAALSSARMGAMNVARGFAMDAARDAAMEATRATNLDRADKNGDRHVAMAAGIDAADQASLYVLRGVLMKRSHVSHFNERWAVWKSGRGLLGEVSGELYVYESP